MGETAVSEGKAQETHGAGRVERRADQVLAIIWIGLGVLVGVQGQSLPYMSRFGPGPGFLLVWLAGFCIVLGLLLLLQLTFRPARMGSFALPDALSAWRMAFVMFGFFAFVFFANSVGFLICVAVLSFLLLLVVEGKGWKLSLLVSALMTAGFWIVFEFSLQLRLPKGLLDF